MRLVLLVGLTMTAFAANSVLNRLALSGGAIGPAGFAALRLLSGAAVLAALVRARGRPLGLGAPDRPWSAAALALYMLGFSFAYLSLDSGVGALILFGGVQITMFLAALRAGEPMPPRRWLGALVAFAGLVWLLRPGAPGAPDPAGAALMAAAAVGWGLYSLRGRRAVDPLATTAANFLLAAPVAVLVAVLVPDPSWPTARGAGLALVSGAITSGLGYALWYAVLPSLAASTAAVAQLSVPLIAMAGGALVLGESLNARFAIAAVLVLGGIALSLGLVRLRGRG